MKTIKKIFVFLLLSTVLLTGWPHMAYAYRAPFGPTTSTTDTSTPSPTSDGTDGVAVVNNPLPGSPLDIFHSIINRIVAVFFFAVGLVLIGLIIYGGALYIVDGGNEENAKKARKVITAAIIGIAIMGLTGVIIKFVELIFGISLGL